MNTYGSFVLAAFLCGCGCGVATPATGDKIGQIAKVQSAGLLCKTTEILVTGKFGGGELQLTVPDRLLKEVKAANESQGFMKIMYHTELLNWTCSNETGNQWLDSVEPHAEGAPTTK